MVLSGLSLDQAPPYAVTVKFFLTAFVYAGLAGAFLLYQPSLSGNPAFAHLFTLGFMLMVMTGAILQFLPVVGGVVIPRGESFSNVVYGLLHLGIFAFVAAFVSQASWTYAAAALFLIAGVGVFCAVVIYFIVQSRTQNSSIRAIGLAVLFLLLSLIFGAGLLGVYAYGIFDYATLKTLHLHGVAFGWTLLLVAAISFQVIPMFWVAAPLKEKTKRFFIYGFAVLTLLSFVAALWGQSALFTKTLYLLAIIYAAVTLRVLNNRGRKLKDFSVYYFYTAFVSLLAGALLLLFAGQSLLGYVLLGYGFVYGAISAMIYKIIPFITWFHLSAKGVFDMPTMREMVSQKLQRAALVVFGAVYGLLALYVFAGSAFVLQTAAAVFVLLNMLHLYNFAGVIGIYRRYSGKV